MKPCIVIGDIHGDINKLKLLYKLLKSSDREFIFIGDYINRGLYSKEVVDFLLYIKNNHKTTFLMGNHEYQLLQYLENNNFIDFATIGGITTIKSYVGVAYGNVHEQFNEAIPNSHKFFFYSLENYYEDSRYFISHSGINLNNPQSRNLLDLINNNEFAKSIDVIGFNKIVICGHFIQKNKLPYVYKNMICIDTGCGSIDGPLTGLFLPEQKFISS